MMKTTYVVVTELSTEGCFTDTPLFIQPTACRVPLRDMAVEKKAEVSKIFEKRTPCLS